MESKFKVGDKVRLLVDKTQTHWKFGNKGNVFTVVEYTNPDDYMTEYSIERNWLNIFHADIFEIVEEFDLKTQPWFIRVNNEQEFNLVQEWLKENFGTVPYFGWYPQTKGLMNTNAEGKMYSDYVMWFRDDKNLNQNANEIKVNFKTIIDSVEWPVVESEKDKKIRELKETIKKASEQLEKLQKLS